MTVMDMDIETEPDVNMDLEQDDQAPNVEVDTEPIQGEINDDASVKSLLLRKFPRLSSQTIPEVLEVMPSAQVLSLWKTLYTLFHDAIKKLETATNLDSPDTESEFFSAFQYLAEFLEHLRIMDPTFLKMSMTKVEHLMTKVSNGGIKKFGLLLLEKKYENEMFISFLKLVYIWGELRGILTHYGKRPNPEVTGVDFTNTSAENLVFVHSYFTATEWNLISQQIDGFGDSKTKYHLVKLIGQKLKFLQILQKNEVHTDANITATLHTSALFVWKFMKENPIDNYDSELYELVLPLVGDQDIVELSNLIVQQIPLSPGKDFLTIWNSTDSRLPYAMLLSIFKEIFLKLSKSSLQKSLMKKLAKEVFLNENFEILIKESKDYVSETKTQNYLSSLLKITNDGLTSGCESVNHLPEPEFVMTFVEPLFRYLANLPLEDFPKSIRTLVLLASISCLIPLSKCTKPVLMDKIVSIIAQCASDFKGNDIIFHINWLSFFKWFITNMGLFEVNNQRRLAFLILRNIYVSSSIVLSFHQEVEQYMNVTDLTTHHSTSVLYVLEFLNKLYEEFIHSKTKSKIFEQAKLDRKKFADWVLQRLEVKTKVKQSSKHYHFNMNFFHGLLVLQDKFNADTNTEDVSENLKSILSNQVDAALKYLTKAKDNSESPNSNYLQFLVPSRHYALGFLYSYLKSGKEIPQDFVKNLWEIVKYGSGQTAENIDDVTIISSVDIFKLSSDDEFQEILDNVVENWGYDEEMSKPLCNFMTQLLDSDIGPAKKTMRRKAIENCLLKIVTSIGKWKCTPESLNCVILPFLQFQTTLIRRRYALCSTNSLSLCLTSITSVPLAQIVDIKSFRKIFCSVAELLNSFTVHRLDVLSFRGHVHLQCFQYLVEVLTMKADQGKNHSDEDILELKYCAHSIERICQSAKLGQKEFTRMSPYFIGLLMRQFEIFTVYPAVKEPLLSGCYKLLDLCDNHGIAQLNSMFTLGSREIFKTVYDVYKKFYRYLGKV